MRQLLKIFTLCTFIAVAFTACNDDAEVGNDQALIEEAEELVARSTQETASGRWGCYEIIFPITIDHPDGSTSEVMSWQEAKDAFITWREANPDIQGRSQLQFPLELVLENGTMISVDDRLSLRQLRVECRRQWREDRQGDRCFTLVYPIQVTFPDGSLVTYDDRRSVKIGLREWRRDNRGSTDRPSLVFPLAVELEDGEIVEAASREALAAIKQACSE